jgi:sporadic carbohydrate cluster protein (TIGR04323 family)
VVENITPRTYLVLERIVAEAHLFQAIAMCSISMLPNNSERRTTLLERCVNAGMTLHFIFESLVVTRHEDIADVNQLVALMGLSKKRSNRVSYIKEIVNNR